MYLCLFFTYPEAIRYGLLSIATTCLEFLMASFFVPELMVEVKVITLFLSAFGCTGMVAFFPHACFDLNCSDVYVQHSRVIYVVIPFI